MRIDVYKRQGRDDRTLQELIVRVYTNLQCYPDPAATADRWEVMLDVTDCTDPGQTIWGEWLLRELQRGLQSDAAMLRRALALAEENEAVSAYVPVLQAKDVYKRQEGSSAGCCRLLC